MDRRQFLGAALAAGTGAFLAACGTGSTSSRGALSTIGKATSVPPAGSDLGAIEHVVFLMMENRSFDHYFGTFPGVRGFDDHPAGSLGVFSQPWPANTTKTPDGKLLPFHLDVASGHGECTHDLSHNWLPQHDCFAGGAMDGFVTTHTSALYEGPDNGVLTMGYHTRADIPYYYALAEAFTICDGYHCSVMGPTHPNRLMAMSGTIDPAGTAGGPVLITNGSPDALWSVHWDTMPEVLEDAGISWKTYSPPGASYRPTNPEVMLVSDAILPYFSQYKSPSSPLYQKAFTPTFPADFQADVRNGTLPQVSWIIPPLGYDEHPPSAPMLGEWFTDQVLSALVANPEVWSKTVLFQMYDENDGFFDHVAPPVPPAGTAGEYLTVNPLPATAQGVQGPVGLGFRVPMLVVSPFSRGGYVCSQTFDHTSQLRFLEERFGVKAPNISAWRRKTVGDLTATVDTAKPDTSAPQLPSTAGYTVAAAMAAGCTTTDIIEVNTSQPPYPIPAVQHMAVQEAGKARRRA